jgi:DNA gyrase inhibitor GyrI
MNVEIVTFPETRVAVIEHRGAPSLEHATALKLVEWKIQNRLLDQSKVSKLRRPLHGSAHDADR